MYDIKLQIVPLAKLHVHATPRLGLVVEDKPTELSCSNVLVHCTLHIAHCTCTCTVSPNISITVPKRLYITILAW